MATSSLTVGNVQIEQSHLLNADETRKRITILPEKLSDDAKLILKRLFDTNLYEVDAKVIPINVN